MIDYDELTVSLLAPADSAGIALQEMYNDGDIVISTSGKKGCNRHIHALPYADSEDEYVWIGSFYEKGRLIVLAPANNETGFSSDLVEMMQAVASNSGLKTLHLDVVS